jgi:hypothetical protein
MDEMPNSVDKHKVPELSDYIELLACLEKLEARVVELERRLLRTDGATHLSFRCAAFN